MSASSKRRGQPAGSKEWTGPEPAEQAMQYLWEVFLREKIIVPAGRDDLIAQIKLVYYGGILDGVGLAHTLSHTFSDKELLCRVLRDTEDAARQCLVEQMPTLN